MQFDINLKALIQGKQTSKIPCYLEIKQHTDMDKKFSSGLVGHSDNRISSGKATQILTGMMWLAHQLILFLLHRFQLWEKKSSKPQSFANCNPLTGLICAWCSFLFTVKLPFVRLSSFCCSFLWSFTTAFLRVWSCVPQSRWNIFVCKILKTFPSISNRGSNRFYVLETGQYRNHYPV